MKTALVTGGAGYVGSHACKALAKAGYRPIVYDNLSRGNEWSVRWGPLIRGDLAERERLKRVFEEHKPEAVLHFAALAYVGESVEDPQRYYTNNVGGSLVLLSAMRAAGCRHIVFSSTCSVYGTPDAMPIRETAPTQPINPYGASKLMIERILADYGASHGLKAVTFRYFNAAGASPDGDIGEAHDPESHLIPRALMAATGELPTLQILGTDYPTPDGTAIRDYVHVADVAAAHVKALQYLDSGGDGAVFNLGTGRGHSVRDVLGAVERVTGRAVPAAANPRRPGDPPELVADSTLARKMLDWAPERSDLDAIVADAWAWHRASSRPAGAGKAGS
ncbi:MAG: UDP-glucose 4-epimerase GalE [Rhodospirillales bacterium]|nr:UDP-glucose 4-epimerase GalE [Rhodospirillales bacterium]